MVPENLLGLFGLALIFVIGIIGIRRFRNPFLQLFAFLIPIFVAAQLAGFLDLTQQTAYAVFLFGAIVLLLIALLAFVVLRQFGLLLRRGY